MADIQLRGYELESGIYSLAVGAANGIRRVSVWLPVPDANDIAPGDVLVDKITCSNVVRIADAHSRLLAIRLMDHNNVLNGGSGKAMDVYFTMSNGAWGTTNTPVTLSTANAQEILGRVPILAADWVQLKTGGSGHQHVFKTEHDIGMPMFFIPDESTRNVYISIVAREAIDTSAATDPALEAFLYLQDLN